MDEEKPSAHPISKTLRKFKINLPINLCLEIKKPKYLGSLEYMYDVFTPKEILLLKFVKSDAGLYDFLASLDDLAI